MNALARKALIALAATPLIAALFLAGVVAAFSVPNAAILASLKDRPELIAERRANNGRVIDADTECIGLSIGLYESDTPPQGLARRAVNAESLYGCDPLQRWLANGAVDAHRDYFRYWHGVTLVMRPLLAVMPYNDMRGLLFTTSGLLLFWLCWRVGADFGPATALAFAAPFVVLNALGLWVVATKATTWLLAIGAAIFFSRRKTNEAPVLAFFALGALTAYFDFLTAPAFVFAMAALVWAIYAAKGEGAFASWRQFLACGVFWSAGWAGFVLIKIIVAAYFLDLDVWGDFIDAALFRLRGQSEHVDGFIPGAALAANLAALKSVWGPVAVIGFFILPFVTRDRRARWAALLQERPVM
ncbi:MAG: hypothetical protein KDA46_13190, partial [Parvularculaceae bacterium]|nr:hypothetical protein [Parvularculaceae bacterium]